MYLDVNHIAVIQACNWLLHKNGGRPDAADFEQEFDCIVTIGLDNTYIVFRDENKYNWFLLQWGG